MGAFEDVFAQSGGGDRFSLAEHYGCVLLVVPVGYKTDVKSNYPNPDKGGRMVNDVSVVDVCVLLAPPASDVEVDKWFTDQWFGSKHARGRTARECNAAQGGRDARPMLFQVDRQQIKGEKEIRYTYGLIDVECDSPELQRYVTNLRDKTVAQIEDEAAGIVTSLQAKALSVYEAYKARQVADQNDRAAEMFGGRPAPADDPWS